MKGFPIGALHGYQGLIFEDWNKSIERQATVLNDLVFKHMQLSCIDLLDCACGIGTQAIGFAQAGHRIVASARCFPNALRGEDRVTAPSSRLGAVESGVHVRQQHIGIELTRCHGTNPHAD